MCGIVGYIGKKDALPILLDGLKQLEYRGYDSAGICILRGQKLKVVKRSGKIKDLINSIKDNSDLDGSNLGIGHSRWATHGAPTNLNAHPHLDCSGDFAIVHNGIIENFNEIKETLLKEGHIFKSDTDTEVIVHLIEKHYNGFLKKMRAKKIGILESAVLRAVKDLKGSFALGVIHMDEPHKLIGVRNKSPLVVGIGKDENFIASDVPAILRWTRKVIYLDDVEMVVLNNKDVHIFDREGKEQKKDIDTIKWNISSARKSGFPHFMLKEIHEQPRVLREIISSHIKGDNEILLDGINLSDGYIKNIPTIIILACGTAYHAGLVGRYILERFTEIPVSVDLSSEFRYRDPIINKGTLVIAISQSGETADTLSAVKIAKEKGARVLSICNVVGSSLVRTSDGVIYTYAGPEIGVASTKAYTAQLCILYLLALYIAKVRGLFKGGYKRRLMEEFKRVPDILEYILNKKNYISRLARRHHNFGSFLYLGRNLDYPTALEGALKLKEISYIPAEGYAGGEMKHGPIALIDEYRAVVCIAPQSRIYEKMISNIQEIYARKGKLIIIATEGDTAVQRFTKEIVSIPKIDEVFSPMVTVLPLQLLAYYIAVRRGCDVDQPRNLAKSVTVE